MSRTPLLVLLLQLAAVAWAAPGDLDPAFGQGGRVSTEILGAASRAADVAVQTDQKVVVAGSASSSFAVVRYRTDGALDPDFGAGGIVTTPIGGSLALARALTIHGDDILVVGDTDPGGVALVRYTTGGQLDGTFGPTHQGGTVIDFVGPSLAGDVAVSPDGIMVAGTTSNPANDNRVQLFVMCVQADGTQLVTGFGTQGMTFLPYFGLAQTRLAVQPDGRILVVVQNPPAGTPRFAVARLNPTGSIDTGFGSDGLASAPFAGQSAADVTVQPDGKIVLAGSALDGDSGDAVIAVARFLPTGELDPDFGTGGMAVAHAAGRMLEANAVAVQGDGRIVVAGDEFSVSTSCGLVQFAAARFNPTGCLDASFGTGGMALTEFGTCSGAHGAALRADGTLIAAGEASLRPVGDFALLGYQLGGSAAFACAPGGGPGPVDCGDPTASFPSVNCRLDALAAAVSAAFDLGPLKGKLVKLLHKADGRQSQAAVRVGSGKTRPARAGIRAAIAALRQFSRRVGSKAGRKAIADPERRATLTGAADPIQADLARLLGSL